MRLGFFAAGDVHERNPGPAGGLAGVWAEANTREAIFDAFWNRRIFATTGLRPDLRFEVSGAFMGSDVRLAEAPIVRLSVSCESPVRRVEIIRDGRIVRQLEANDATVELEWCDAACPRGEHYYYAHVVFDGEAGDLVGNVAPAYGTDAWTSPVRVARS